ncbi:MAG: hypothetical protein M3342_03335 [Bacteroidota bacterium]|nr:hypothetical protein [Bacteroidota bacterium]
MKKFLLLSVTALLFGHCAQTQGCIMIRNISGFGQFNLADNSFSTSTWQVNVIGRYFKSFREFRGTEDVKSPEPGINRVFASDFSVSRFLNNGFSVNLSLPVNANSRSTTTEHGGKGTPRHTTHSFGIGDSRLTVYKWLFHPSVHQKVNFQIGLGIKLPTGDYKYQDYFYRNDSTKVLAPVNASIQLGDGGTGIITELNGFYSVNKITNLYLNLYYLLNPREQNGTLATYGRPATLMQQKTGNDVNSVPDQYSMRAGINFNFKQLSFSAGLRQEGIPVYDLIGGSNGFRRSGYNLSVEPGVVYSLKNISFYTYVPLMVGRTTKQTVPDKIETEITGNYTVGSGGFANFLVFAGVLFKL